MSSEITFIHLLTKNTTREVAAIARLCLIDVTLLRLKQQGGYVQGALIR